jgi:hypothetical protein
LIGIFFILSRLLVRLKIVIYQTPTETKKTIQEIKVRLDKLKDKKKSKRKGKATEFKPWPRITKKTLVLRISFSWCVFTTRLELILSEIPE